MNVKVHHTKKTAKLSKRERILIIASERYHALFAGLLILNHSTIFLSKLQKLKLI